jgi:GAF domain-containing protein
MSATHDLDPISDTARLADIGSYDLESPEVRSRLDELARRAAERFDLPIGMVSIVLDSAQYFAGSHGLSGWMAESGGMPVEWSFCAEVVRTESSYVVGDATLDQLQHDNPVVTHDGVRCYAGVPLTSPGGHVLGSYCLVGLEPHEFSDEDITALKAMAIDVVNEIASHRYAEVSEGPPEAG